MCFVLGWQFFFFFFSSRRRHTRSLCDWSSDVCSSDLDRADDLRMRVTKAHRRIRAHQVEIAPAVDVEKIAALATREHDGQRIVIAGAECALASDELHRDRKSVV